MTREQQEREAEMAAFTAFDHSPGARVILMGDPEQLGPIVLAEAELRELEIEP